MQDNLDEIRYIYFLSQIKNLGNVNIRKLIEKYPTIESLKENIGSKDLDNNRRIDFKYELNNYRVHSENLERILEKSEKNSFRIISINSNSYPCNLRTIYDPPVLLYIKGQRCQNDEFSISVVGTRYPSDYGISVCSDFIKKLSRLNIPIISGMARGIDSIAHKTSLICNNPTYAVLGCGIDVIYPNENKLLYENIIENGLIISEFEPGTKPDKINFPRRNRIISGISRGTIIIETGLKGGAMITAGFALDQDREIFAVPGKINSLKSSGCNELIRAGKARIITKIEDLYSELNINSEHKQNKKIIELNIFEKKILEILNNEPIHIDKISELSGLSISDCLVNLLSLELKDAITQLPGKYFKIL